MLRVFHEIPDGLLQAGAGDLQRLLGGPSLIHLEGRRGPPLFVSVLLHGNETTGFEAIQQLLGRYNQRGREIQLLPRPLSVFIGNVAAARHGVRRLDGQPDYNRVWPGSESSDSDEHQMMRQIVASMRERGVFASVDVHNNTGLNPHYGCVNRIDTRFLRLASLFSRTVVYFLRPRGVQSMAFAELCPAVTLECGQAGQRHSVEHAMEYLQACLHLTEISEHPVAPHDLDLFHTVATVRIPAEVHFGFGVTEAELNLQPDLDHMNFTELPGSTMFGFVRDAQRVPLGVHDEQGCDVAERYFALEGNRLVTRMPVMPSMLTLNERVIRQDCLCYLMERYPLPGHQIARDVRRETTDE